MTKNVMSPLPEPVEGRRQRSLVIEDPFVAVGSLAVRRTGGLDVETEHPSLSSRAVNDASLGVVTALRIFPQPPGIQGFSDEASHAADTKKSIVVQAVDGTPRIELLVGDEVDGSDEEHDLR
jgi:hypothetical protein